MNYYCKLVSAAILGLAALSARTADKEAFIMQPRSPVGPDWVPFSLDRTTAQPPVWDFSRYCDAPAGKYGFLRVDGPHFEAGGKKIRLWGTNISGPACFPTHDDARRAAAFLKRWGFNAVRLSHLDASWANGLIDYRNRTAMAFNEERFDRFFFFLAELKKNGLYYVIDGRHDFEFRTDEFKYLGEIWRRGGSPILLCFSTAMQRHHEKYLRRLFLTANPYTGLKLSDDPALAGVQMINESFLLKNAARIDKITALPAPLQAEFQQQWQAWSKQNRLAQAYDDAAADVRRRFFSWLERSNFQRLYQLYRRDFGLKCPLATTSCYVGATSLPSAVDGDYTEGHGYYSHPHNEKVTFGKCQLNLSRMETDPGYVGGNYLKWLPFLLQQRIGYQPYVVGEWNNCLPERFDGPLLMAVFGDVQDFDGMFLFNLVQSDWSQIGNRNIGTFVSIENPSVMINMIPAALAWHGRMIPAAVETLAVKVPETAVFEVAAAKAAGTTNFGKVIDAEGKEVKIGGEKYGVGVFTENLWLFRLFNCPEVPGIRQPTTANRLSCFQRSEKEFPALKKTAAAQSPVIIRDNMVTVKTPQWVSIWGRLGGKTVTAKPLTIAAEPEQDFSVTAVSLDGRPLTASRKVLIAVGPVSVARETVLLEQTDRISGRLRARWQMNKTEKDPMAKPVRAELGFAGPDWQCSRVSATGVKEERIATTAGDDGIKWNLDPKRPSWFYLLER